MRELQKYADAQTDFLCKYKPAKNEHVVKHTEFVRKKEICGGRKEIEECHKEDNEDLPA